MNNHAPLIATLKKGTIKLKESSKEEHTFSVNGGVVEVLNNNVTVLAE